MYLENRAKEQITGEWLEGFYTGSEFFLSNENGGQQVRVVLEDTVGIYIGRNCANSNRKIFTGDIVVDNSTLSHKDKYIVIWDDYNLCFALKRSLTTGGTRKIGSTSIIYVGNIHDNEFVESDSVKESPSETRSSARIKNKICRETAKDMKLK